MFMTLACMHVVTRRTVIDDDEYDDDIDK